MCETCEQEFKAARRRNAAIERQKMRDRVSKGVITDVSYSSTSGRKEVTLTIRLDDGTETTERFNYGMYPSNAMVFKRTYGRSVLNAEGFEVNFYHGDRVNPAHIIKEDLPMKTIGGSVLVPEWIDLPAPTAY